MWLHLHHHVHRELYNWVHIGIYCQVYLSLHCEVYLEMYFHWFSLLHCLLGAKPQGTSMPAFPVAQLKYLLDDTVQGAPQEP